MSRGKEPPEQISVPPVTSLSLDNAKQLLKSAGLTVTVTYENSDTVPSGSVISCDPGEGTEVDEGTNINLVVSQGPAATPATPDSGDSTE